MLVIVCNASFSTTATCRRKSNGLFNSQTEKLPGDLQDAEYLFVAGFQFREEFLVQLNAISRWRPRSRLFISQSPKSRRCCTTFKWFEDWEVSFEETFHRRFVVLALECPRASPLIIYLLNK
jgi:hypothetical protein